MRRFWLKKDSRIWDLSSDNLALPSANFMADPQGLGVKVTARLRFHTACRKN